MNSRPTVYEGVGSLNDSARDALISARTRALDTAAVVRAGGKLAAARLVTALEAIVEAVDLALASGAPKLRAVKGGRS